MVATTIYGINPLKSSTPGPEGHDLGTWYVALDVWVQLSLLI